MMDTRIQSLLADYHVRAESERKLMNELPQDQLMSKLDDFLLPVGESSGTLLNILVKALKAQTILELGTSYGYSTVWLAEAAKETGGKVVTLELSTEKSAYAKAQLGKVGLDAFVDFRVGDALEALKGVPGPIDFVLVDLWKDLYIPCFDLFAPKLGAGAMVAADNMIEPSRTRPEAEAYRAHVRASGKFDSVLLPVGSGIELSRLR
jgi:predicted O-methyltransferase YrrM